MLAPADEQAAFAKPPDALSAGLLKPKNSAAPTVMPSASNGQSNAPIDMGMSAPPAMPAAPILGKIILFLLLAILVGVAAYGGWWFYYNKFAAQNSVDTTADINAVAPVTQPLTDNQTVAPAVENNNNQNVAPADVQTAPGGPLSTTSEALAENVEAKVRNDSLLFGEPIDSDSDGLDDVREKEIGANVFNPDTDGDRLGDGAEVIIWKTDPLKQDSDNDGYKDGAEVYNGYNPLGPGKLPTATARILNITSTLYYKINTTTVNK